MKSNRQRESVAVPTSRRHHTSMRLSAIGAAVASAMAAIIPAPHAAAATKTWTGGGNPVFDWTLGANWDASTAPVANDSLVFTGAGVTANNDFTAGTAFNGITFDALAGAFTLTGNGLVNTGSIVNNSASLQTINAELVSGTAAFAVSGSGDIALQRVQMTAPRALTMNGTGTLTLGNASASTHNNLLSLVVNSGTVNLGMAGTNIAVDRGLTLNAGTVRYTGTSTNMLTDAQALTINGGTFDMNGLSDAIGGLNGTGGTVQNGAAATTSTLTVGNSNTSGSYAGAISDGAGTIAIIKAGTGTQTLTGPSTYTGGTTAAGGILALGNASAIGTGTLTMGGGGIDNVSAGAMTVSNAVTWANATNVFGGTQDLTLSGTQTITTASGTAVNLQLNGTAGKSLTLGTLTTSVDADRNLNVNPQNISNSYTFSNTSLVVGDIQIGATGGGAGARTFTIGGGSNTNVAQVVVNGVISDGATAGNALTVVNTGTTTLNGANTFTGLATLGSSGNLHSATVVLGNKNALGADGGNINFNSATVRAGVSLTGANAIARNLFIQGGVGVNPSNAGTSEVAGSNSIEFAGSVTNSGGNRTLLVTNSGGTTLSGQVNLASDGATARTFNVIASGPTTISGSIVNNAFNPATASNLSIAGTNTLTLSGANAYSGTTSLLGGTVVLDYGSQNNQKFSPTAALIVSGGANLVLSGGAYSEAVNGVTLNGGASLNVSRPSGTSTLALGTIGRAGTARSINVASGVTTTNTLNGSAGIIGGWATVNGSDFAVNSINAAGGSIVGLASYQTGAEATWAATDNVSISADPAISDNRTINTLKTTTGFVIPAGKTLTITDGGLINAGGGARTIGGGTLKAGQATTSELIVHQHGTGSLTINSVIANGNGASQLTKTGDGVLVLGANNTYTGATNVTRGTLRLGVNNAINPGTTQDVLVAGGAKFDLNGFNQTLRNVNPASNSIGTGEITNSSATTSTLTLNTTTTNGSSNLLWTGNLALVIKNPGNQYQISNPWNSYSGGTTIQGTGSFSTSQLNAAGGVTRTGITTQVRGNSETALGTGTITLDNGSITFPSNTNYIVANNFLVTANGGEINSDNSSSAYTGSISSVGGATPLLALTAVAARPNLRLAGSQANFAGTFAVDSVNANVFLSGNARGSANADLVFFGSGTTLGLVRWDGSTSSPVTINYGDVSNLAGHTATTGGLSSNVAANVTFALGKNASSTATFGGVISNGSGTVSLTKGGTNTQVLTGANTYTGATTINGGALRVNGSLAATGTVAVNATGTGAGTLQGSGTVGSTTLSANNGANVARISPGAGSGSVATINLSSLTVNGGDLQLDMIAPGNNDIVNVTGTGTGALTFAAPSTISVNPAAAGSYTLLQSGSNIVYTVAPTLVPQVRATMTVDTTTDPTKYVVNVSAIGSVSLNWTGAVDGNWDTQATANWQSPSLASDVFFSGDTVSFGDGPTNRSVTIPAAGVLPAQVTVNNSAANGYTIGGGAINGFGSLTKSGAGSLTLSSANAYSGGTVLNAGTLKVGNAAALGTGALTGASGSTIDLNGTNLVVESTATVASTITNTAATAGSIAVSGGTFSGTIQDGPGSVGVTNNAGTLTLSGSNSHSGANTANAGATIIAGSATALGGPNASLVVNGGGAIDLGGFSRTVGALGGTAGTVSSATPMTLTVNQSVGTTFAGQLTGPVSLVKQGTGTLGLSGANTYTGSTLLSGGAVLIPNNSYSPFGSTGTLTLASNSSSAPIMIVQPNSGGLTTNAILLSNPIVVQAGTTNVIDNSVNGFGNLWLGGAMTGSGSVVLLNSNGSTSQFAATSATLFLGDRMSGFTGTVRLESSNPVGRSFAFIAMEDLGDTVTTWDASQAAWVLGSDASGGAGIIKWNNAQAGPVTVKLGSVAGAAPTSQLAASNTALTTFEVGALNTSTTYAGRIVNAGTGVAALTKVGSGTLTLTGSNTYTGLTKVAGGKLVMKVSSGAAEPVLGGPSVPSPAGADVNSGALVFDYAGATSPASQVAPILAAGNAINFASGQIFSSGTITGSIRLGWYDNVAAQTLTIGRTLTGDANVDFRVNFDDLLLLAANYNSASGTAWGRGDFNYDGNVSFDDLLLLAANYNQSLSGTVGGDWALAQASVVPEPASFGVVIGSGIMMTMRRRARRR